MSFVHFDIVFSLTDPNSGKMSWFWRKRVSRQQFSIKLFFLRAFGKSKINDMYKYFIFYIECIFCLHIYFVNWFVSLWNIEGTHNYCLPLQQPLTTTCFFDFSLWWFLKEAENISHLEVTDNVRITGKVNPSDYYYYHYTGCVNLSWS